MAFNSCDFNTTSVFIKPFCSNSLNFFRTISIQHLFLLNKQNMMLPYRLRYFNTTSVFIKLFSNTYKAQPKAFQYNICFY